MSTRASQASILVVDDEPDLRTLYELTLLREGYAVSTAENLLPVSYTHLDVYKRQVDRTRPVWLARQARDSHAVHGFGFAFAGLRGLTFRHGSAAGAVSYTHLDVYKRQDVGHAITHGGGQFLVDN